MIFDWPLVWESMPLLLEASVVTLKLTLISSLIGFLMAILLSTILYKKIPILTPLIRAYIFFFRGTPLLVQIFLIYYGLGQFADVVKSLHLWWFFKEAYLCGLAALTLNTAAYTTVLIEGGMLKVSRGELEAAQALGMKFHLILKRILYPRALQMIIPAYGNEFILLLKATSLVSTITVMDLMGMARKISTATFAPIELFISAGAIYLVFTTLFTLLFKQLENRLSYPS